MRVNAGLHGIELGLALGDLKEIHILHVFLQLVAHVVKAVSDACKFVIAFGYGHAVG